MDVRVLSFHARYRCENAGACCSSSWPIGVEPPIRERVTAAMSAGALRVISGESGDAFVGQADGSATLGVLNGRCVFHNSAGSCAIHSALGHEALPLACRQFPRVSVIDPRGVSVTLSHYCPTAAALINDAPARRSAQREGGNDELAHRSADREGGNDREREIIVVNARGFPPHGEYVGLDARTPLPPLLRAGMLMDWESWWEIERRAVELLITRTESAADALAQLRSAVREICAWTPDNGSLAERVQSAFLNPAGERSGDHVDLLAAARKVLPSGVRYQTEWTAQPPASDLATRRFLAAHAFANWTIHLGQGLQTWLRSIETANALIQAGAGIRQADLLLRHLVDPKAWTTALDGLTT